METSSLFFSTTWPAASPLAGKVQPPTWVVDELHQRLVLLLNHVLMQEPEAMARLARVRGKSCARTGGKYSLGLVATRLVYSTAPNAKADSTFVLQMNRKTHNSRLLAGQQACSEH
ncbi:MAG: hypothetical protein IPI14_12305 [Polaromonas sp.]|nr:hypothetical protein [Polaromonas sp.]